MVNRAWNVLLELIFNPMSAIKAVCNRNHITSNMIGSSRSSKKLPAQVSEFMLVTRSEICDSHLAICSPCAQKSQKSGKVPLKWRHIEHDSVSNHRRLDGLLNCLFGHRSKKTPKLRVTGLCEGNPPVTSGFSPHRVSNAKNVSIWWRHLGSFCRY